MNSIKFQGTHHSAVYLNNYVIILGGFERGDDKPLSTSVIWMYNLYSAQWRKHVIPEHESGAPDMFHDAVVVAINETIYIFGGADNKGFRERNALWTLSKTKTGCFKWSFIESRCDKESPSPRKRHTGWEYARQLWVFGGEGPSPQQYLNNHGDVAVGFNENHTNNQLLCYNPNISKWTNPQCFGSVPSPRSDHASASLKDKAWVFGGSSYDYWNTHDDILELTMHSFTWTQIYTSQPRPQARKLCTLTAVTLTDDHLVLHGGTWRGSIPMLSETWIMNLTSHSWTQYTSRRDHSRWSHTASLGLNNNVIIIGGLKGAFSDLEYDNMFHVMLEAKSLQQLAIQAIYKHQHKLNWNCLPQKLISQLGFCIKNDSDTSAGFESLYSV